MMGNVAANMAVLRPIVPDLPWEDLLDWFRDQPTRLLKAMWDSEQGEIYCDEIHRVMNERGEGAYVAV